MSVEHKYVPMVSGATRRNRLQIRCNEVPLGDVTARDVGAVKWKVFDINLIAVTASVCYSYINQCTYSLSGSVKWPSGLVMISVHNDLPSVLEPANVFSKSNCTVGCFAASLGLIMLPQYTGRTSSVEMLYCKHCNGLIGGPQIGTH